MPILGVPLLYEQKLNAELIRKNNLGGVVDFNNFNQGSPRLIIKIQSTNISVTLIDIMVCDLKLRLPGDSDRSYAEVGKGSGWNSGNK